ncbi:hypothetical protein AB0K09_31390, partial [Streptomyces sp. NPDC049577]
RVAVAPYLLAPGDFARRAGADATGADLVSAPLGPHGAVARLVLRRYDETAPAAAARGAFRPAGADDGEHGTVTTGAYPQGLRRA